MDIREKLLKSRNEVDKRVSGANGDQLTECSMALQARSCGTFVFTFITFETAFIIVECV